MEIVRTLAELNELLEPLSGSVARATFWPKAIGEHHSGHEAIINRAKQIRDKVLVTYWGDSLKLLGAFYLDDCSWIVNKVFNFDEQYCLNWCQAQNVDFVFIPEETEISKVIEGQSIEALKTWADNLFQANGYNKYNCDLASAKYAAICAYCATLNSYISTKADAKVDCWKDGFHRFIIKHVLENTFGNQIELINPVRDEYGFPTNTSTNISLTIEEKMILGTPLWSILNTASPETVYADVKVYIEQHGFSLAKFQKIQDEVVGTNNTFYALAVQIPRVMSTVNVTEFFTDVA